ncbi:hypothetical protein HU200_016227 [Digitaria exilis]|uniref:Uncharacterized protein n=1 Tax=Digitaria exilis TaxID=1010633 RepID=A0A835F9L3_9POAL|nr:hypothetical protein HU200_016227 [Digitaria exilis]
MFFRCPITKVVWGIVAQTIGANDAPGNLNQYWKWIDKYFPNNKQVHSFGLAAICWAIWKARNRACFDKKLIRHPTEIICHACSFMDFWTGLHKVDLQAQLNDGMKILLATACRILVNQQSAPPAPLRLMPVPEEDGQEDEHLTTRADN